MKTILTMRATTFLTVCLSSAVALADQHAEGAEYPDVVPVETWTCDFNDGRDMNDLNAVIGEWNEWLDEEEVNDYFAAVVTPHYFGEVMFDIAWLGAWRHGNAMGTGTDLWVTEGGELAAKFNEVLTCKSHTNFASMNIKPPGDDEDDDTTFVLSFTNCSAEDGKTFDDIMAGLNAWAAHTTESGFQNSMWIMFPIYGESNTDYDFKVVEGYDDHSAFGNDYELMGNGGHWVKSGEIFDDLLECDVARVYDAKTVRDMEAGGDG